MTSHLGKKPPIKGWKIMANGENERHYRASLIEAAALIDHPDPRTMTDNWCCNMAKRLRISAGEADG